MNDQQLSKLVIRLCRELHGLTLDEACQVVANMMAMVACQAPAPFRSDIMANIGKTAAKAAAINSGSSATGLPQRGGEDG